MKSLALSTPSSSGDFFGVLISPSRFVRGGVFLFRSVGVGLSGLGMVVEWQTVQMMSIAYGYVCFLPGLPASAPRLSDSLRSRFRREPVKDMILERLRCSGMTMLNWLIGGAVPS
jgi:hypothetical protein